MLPQLCVSKELLFPRFQVQFCNSCNCLRRNSNLEPLQFVVDLSNHYATETNRVEVGDSTLNHLGAFENEEGLWPVTSMISAFPNRSRLLQACIAWCRSKCVLRSFADQELANFQLRYTYEEKTLHEIASYRQSPLNQRKTTDADGWKPFAIGVLEPRGHPASWLPSSRLKRNQWNVLWTSTPLQRRTQQRRTDKWTKNVCLCTTMQDHTCPHRLQKLEYTVIRHPDLDTFGYALSQQYGGTVAGPDIQYSTGCYPWASHKDWFCNTVLQIPWQLHQCIQLHAAIFKVSWFLNVFLNS